MAQSLMIMMLHVVSTCIHLYMVLSHSYPVLSGSLPLILLQLFLYELFIYCLFYLILLDVVLFCSQCLSCRFFVQFPVKKKKTSEELKPFSTYFSVGYSCKRQFSVFEKVCSIPIYKFFATTKGLQKSTKLVRRSQRHQRCPLQPSPFPLPCT